MGRFISEDTYLGNVSDPMSLNLYTYCNNNPVMLVDPSGHVPINEDIINQLIQLGYTEEEAIQMVEESQMRADEKASEFVGNVFDAVDTVLDTVSDYWDTISTGLDVTAFMFSAKDKIDSRGQITRNHLQNMSTIAEVYFDNSQDMESTIDYVVDNQLLINLGGVNDENVGTYVRNTMNEYTYISLTTGWYEDYEYHSFSDEEVRQLTNSYYSWNQYTDVIIYDTLDNGMDAVEDGFDITY